MKISWKIVSVTIGCLLVVSYLVFAGLSFSGRSSSEVCHGVQITMEDSASIGFVTSKDIARLLDNRNIRLLGETMKHINLSKVESVIKKNQYIDRVDCYKTLDGNIKINIWQRQPIVHVMNYNNFYLDNAYHKMPYVPGYSAYVPIVSGTVSDRYIYNQLFPFIRFLQGNEFWNSQIEQIYVHNDSTVELVPRVGDCIINLGPIDRYEQKLDKLLNLYMKAFNKIGWNKYSYIDLQYRDRVICTKKDTEQPATVQSVVEGTEPIQ
jgi:cell division protein FtsQ